MSEWRMHVSTSPWRCTKKATNTICGDVVYLLEAMVKGEWMQFGMIDMDVAGEGWGDRVAQEIVNQHNEATHDHQGPQVPPSAPHQG